MAWIESHQELARHPKTFKAARMLGISRPTVIGHLHLLWWWALDYAQDGDLSHYDPEEIAEGACWEGDPGRFLDALEVAGFVDHEGDTRVLHDWHGGRHSLPERNAMRMAWEAMAKRVRPIIFEWDRHQCTQCGDTRGLEVDHIVPIAAGGTNDLDNLQTLCRACNRSKGAG